MCSRCIHTRVKASRADWELHQWTHAVSAHSSSSLRKADNSAANQRQGQALDCERDSLCRPRGQGRRLEKFFG
jgi:hypothetical protein